MGKYDKMREVLHDAYMLKAIEDMQDYPGDEEVAKIHKFSPELERNIQLMLKGKFDKIEPPSVLIARKKRRKKIIKRASVAAAVIVVLISTTMIAVPAVRNSFVQIVDGFFAVNPEVGEDSDLLISDYRVPEFVPKEFAISNIEKTGRIYKITYMSNEHFLSYKQRRIAYITDILIDYQNDKSYTIEIDGYSKVFYAVDSQALVLSDEDYCYVIQSDLPLETLLQISQSITTAKEK